MMDHYEQDSEVGHNQDSVGSYDTLDLVTFDKDYPFACHNLV